MRQPLSALACGVVLAAACGDSGPRSENSAICGISMLAAATRIVDQFSRPHSALTDPPPGLGGGSVAARAVGYGTQSALAGLTDDGRAVVGYDGPGFPATPGFGVALVDDSSEVFRGILIWDKEPPPDDYPRIGAIAGPTGEIPLIGVRIYWPSVNSDRCPLFADSIARPTTPPSDP